MKDNRIKPQTGGVITGRKLEWYHHTSRPEWGYTEEQTDMEVFSTIHEVCMHCLCNNDLRYAGKGCF